MTLSGKIKEWCYKTWLRRREAYEAKQANKICHKHGVKLTPVQIFDRIKFYCDPCAKVIHDEACASTDRRIAAHERAAVKRFGPGGKP